MKVDEIIHPKTNQMIEAIENKDFDQMCDSIGNVLEDVTLKLYPEVAVLKEQMQKFGADAVLMSGSGPTVFGLVQQESRVQRIYNGLRGFCDEVYAVRLIGETGYTCLNPDDCVKFRIKTFVFGGDLV